MYTVTIIEILCHSTCIFIGKILIIHFQECNNIHFNILLVTNVTVLYLSLSSSLILVLQDWPPSATPWHDTMPTEGALIRTTNHLVLTLMALIFCLLLASLLLVRGAGRPSMKRKFGYLSKRHDTSSQLIMQIISRLGAWLVT